MVNSIIVQHAEVSIVRRAMVVCMTRGTSDRFAGHAAVPCLRSVDDCRRPSVSLCVCASHVPIWLKNVVRACNSIDGFAHSLPVPW